MGESKEKGQLDASEILLQVGIMAEIYPFMIDGYVELRRGLILYVESQAKCDNVLRYLKGMGAVMINSLKKKRFKVPNYVPGVHLYNLYDKGENIEAFLNCEGIFPVLIVHSIVPESLRGISNLLPLEMDESLRTEEILGELKKVRIYVRQAPELVQSEMAKFATSKFEILNRECSPLRRALAASIAVYCKFYRDSHTEIETNQKYLELHKYVKNVERLSQTYSKEINDIEGLKNVIKNYVKRNENLRIGNINELEGDLLRAIQNESAILYDSQYYYMPDQILRESCDEILSEYSILNIKSALQREGFLICNNCRERNYTVKKILTSVYGHSFRKHFLKISRSFFENVGEIGL